MFDLHTQPILKKVNLSNHKTPKSQGRDYEVCDLLKRDPIQANASSISITSLLKQKDAGVELDMCQGR